MGQNGGWGRRIDVSHPCLVQWGPACAGSSSCQQGLWAQAGGNQPSPCLTRRRGSERCIRSLWPDQGYLSTRMLSLGTSPFPPFLYSVPWFARTREAIRTPCGCAFQRSPWLGGSVLSQENQKHSLQSALCFKTQSRHHLQAQGPSQSVPVDMETGSQLFPGDQTFIPTSCTLSFEHQKTWEAELGTGRGLGEPRSRAETQTVSEGHL